MKKYKKIVSAIIAFATVIGCFVIPVKADGVNYKDWTNVWWTSAEDGLSKIPEQYSFKLEGDEADVFGKTPLYQVIDTEEADGKKNYLIIRLEAVAGRGRISASAEQMYAPKVEGTLAYWIDKIWTGNEVAGNDYSSIFDVKGTLLNESFKDYLVEREWVIEKCSGAGLEQSSITAKAVIPSASEIDYYVNKINGGALSSGTGMNASVTRTPKGIGKIVYVQGENATTGKLGMQSLAVNTSDCKRIWGMFWVSEDFFKNVKVDVDTLGDDVLLEVLEANDNSEEALRAIGYSTGDLVKMGVVEPPVEPKAENVLICAKEALPGYPVTVDYEYYHKEDKEQGETKIYWYVGDSEDGEFEKIQGAEGNKWYISNVCEERYIKAKVVPVTYEGIEATEDFFSENAIKVGEGLKAFNPDRDGGWGLPSDMPDVSPAEYKFALKNPSNAGFTYHMLDTEIENGEGKFFILQMGTMISNGRITSDASNYKFDPSVKYSVAGWLNDVWTESSTPGQSDYYNTGGNGPLNNNATAIDSNIKPYLINHIWRTERSGGDCVVDDFIFEAKAALLSTTEFFEHYHKFGYKDYGKAWLRTPTEVNGTAKYFLINSSSWVWAKNGGAESNIHMYRPVYYLSENFFKDVRLDDGAVGSEVARMIRSVIPKEEMLKGKAGYTEEELTEVFGYPEKTGYVEKTVIRGDLSVSKTVLAEFDFNKNGLDKNMSDEVRYQWYRADEKDGEWQAIENADGMEYKITGEDLDKFLGVKFTVLNEDGQVCTPGVALTGIKVSEAPVIDIELVCLSEGEAEFEVTNNDGAKVLSFIIALYDSENEMCALNSECITVEPGTDNYYVSVDMPDTEKEYKCRVMVLDNEYNLRPLFTGEI